MVTKIEDFRDLLEEHECCLTDRRNMYNYVPYILQQEEKWIHDEITERVLSAVFYGTARFGEALAVILQFVSDDWVIQQCLVRV